MARALSEDLKTVPTLISGRTEIFRDEVAGCWGRLGAGAGFFSSSDSLSEMVITEEDRLCFTIGGVFRTGLDTQRSMGSGSKISFFGSIFGANLDDMPETIWHRCWEGRHLTSDNGLDMVRSTMPIFSLMERAATSSLGRGCQGWISAFGYDVIGSAGSRNN